MVYGINCTLFLKLIGIFLAVLTSDVSRIRDCLVPSTIATVFDDGTRCAPELDDPSEPDGASFPREHTLI
jgi:hypothetical protein